MGQEEEEGRRRRGVGRRERYMRRVVGQGQVTGAREGIRTKSCTAQGIVLNSTDI